MYKSPIELLVTDIQHQIVKQQDEEIYKAVLHYVPNVDKEELIRALNYDRNQYNNGYMDGKADAMASIVRCKDCEDCVAGYCAAEIDGVVRLRAVKPDDFCAWGERKDND